MLNPADDALLNDLLDERLAPADEAAVAARLEREPALREAWDELVRARELVREVPDPQPPADFVARVRARIEADLPAASQGPSAAREPELAAPRPEPVPLAWRRLMLVAYAAAAALVLGIGLFALRDRERPAGGESRETALARAEPEPGDAATRARRESPDAEADRLEAGRTADDERRDPRNAVPPVAEPVAGAVPAESAPGRTAGERGLRSKAEHPASGEEKTSSGAGFAGPGGSVPPGLRTPSDAPPAPAGPAPKPAAAVAPPASGAPAAPPAPPAPSPLPTPAPDADADAAPSSSGEVLVLEAASLESGRELLRSITAGPGARPAGGGGAADGKARASTPVSLRRLDARRDAALIGALQRFELARSARPAPAAAPPPTTPPPAVPAAPAAGAVPPSGGPAPAPAPPGSPAPLEARAPARPAAVGVLGLESLDLAPDEYARLAALLGPPSGPGVASADDAPKKDADKGGAVSGGVPATRRVRVLIVAPPR